VTRLLTRTVAITICVLLIPLTAIVTAGVKQRFNDGPNRVFSGGPLLDGELYIGAEPDWQFTKDVPTIELQLLDPPLSRRIWTVEHNGKLFVWSGYMGSFVGQLWKRWPGQAEEDGRAIIRINDTRYKRHLERITTGAELDGIAAAVTQKYPSQMSRATIESGDVWLFEAGPWRQ
jgi:hypothetical protein